MSQADPAPDRIADILNRLLRWATWLAAVVIAVGGIGYLARHGSEKPDYGTFVGEPTDLRTISGVLSSIADNRMRAIIQLGLLILIATPIARVAVALVSFARARDVTYVVAAILVLTALCYSVLGS